jgi:Kdo2-lipid IVA lauroyltransferase/acyltransferase
MGEGFFRLSFLRRSLKKARRAAYPAALKPLEAWSRTLSDETSEIWARRLGRLAYRLLPAARGRALGHLRHAFGQSLSEKQIRQIAVESFQNLVLNFLEFGRLGSIDHKRLLEKIEVDGWEYVEAAHRAGRGGIFVTGHIGNWELSGAYVALRGYPMNAVARRIYLDPLNQRLTELRALMGVRTLYREGTMRSMIRCLQNNQFLAILPDQDVKRVRGIFVDFFSHPAYTPVGPALLGLASGSPILIARGVRQGSRHLLRIDPPIYADRSAPRDEEVRRLVTLYTNRLEAFIREYPSQWVWTHRRWRTRPSDVEKIQDKELCLE